METVTNEKVETLTPLRRPAQISHTHRRVGAARRGGGRDVTGVIAVSAAVRHPRHTHGRWPAPGCQAYFARLGDEAFEDKLFSQRRVFTPVCVCVLLPR